MISDIRSTVRAARYGISTDFPSTISTWEWRCDKCYKEKESGSVCVSSPTKTSSWCVRCARSLKQSTVVKTIERHVSNLVGVLTVQWEKYREASWTIILACLAIAASTGAFYLVYESIDWIGIPKKSITYGVIGDVWRNTDGTSGLTIETPLGNDIWKYTDSNPWEIKGEKIKVLYTRSRLSHEFSALEISGDAK